MPSLFFTISTAFSFIFYRLLFVFLLLSLGFLLLSLGFWFFQKTFFNQKRDPLLILVRVKIASFIPFLIIRFITKICCYFVAHSRNHPFKIMFSRITLPDLLPAQLTSLLQTPLA